MLAQALKTKCFNGGVRWADLDEPLPFSAHDKVSKQDIYIDININEKKRRKEEKKKRRKEEKKQKERRAKGIKR